MTYKPLFDTITVHGRIIPARELFSSDADVESFLAKNPHFNGKFAKELERGSELVAEAQPAAGGNADTSISSPESGDADSDL